MLKLKFPQSNIFWGKIDSIVITYQFLVFKIMIIPTVIKLKTTVYKSRRECALQLKETSRYVEERSRLQTKSANFATYIIALLPFDWLRAQFVST